MAISVRRVAIGDAEQLTELLRGIESFDAIEKLTFEDAAAQVEMRIQQCLADDSHLIYVAELSEDKIAGYGSVHWLPYLFMTGREGYVSELFVRVEARSQGVGRRLLETIESEARRRGCQRLSLINLRSRESYQRRFYPKSGWQERTEAANFVYNLT
jgi:GNAT superfamily N-acetyltransferase